MIQFIQIKIIFRSMNWKKAYEWWDRKKKSYAIWTFLIPLFKEKHQHFWNMIEHSMENGFLFVHASRNITPKSIHYSKTTTFHVYIIVLFCRFLLIDIHKRISLAIHTTYDCIPFFVSFYTGCEWRVFLA